MHRPPFGTHDHHFLMIVEFVNVEVLTESLQQSDVVTIREGVAEGKIDHVGLAFEEILEA